MRSCKAERKRYSFSGSRQLLINGNIKKMRSKAVRTRTPMAVTMTVQNHTTSCCWCSGWCCHSRPGTRYHGTIYPLLLDFVLSQRKESILLDEALGLCRNQNTKLVCFGRTQTQNPCVCVHECFAKGSAF